MYTFLDRDERSITLGARKAPLPPPGRFLQKLLYAQGLPLKLFTSFRASAMKSPRPGGFGNSHQFGAEIFGAEGPLAESGVFSLFIPFSLPLPGLSGIGLFINSPWLRKMPADYQKALFFLFQRAER
jgi:histidyl-tRNA synthetase